MRFEVLFQFWIFSSIVTLEEGNHFARIIGRVEKYAVSIIMATKGFTWGKDRK